MPRPHADFVQSQHLPWSRWDGPIGPGLEGKLLSSDRETGATSLLLVVPAGYDHAVTDPIDHDLQVLVIEGDVTVDENPLAAMDHLHLPAGAARSRLRSVVGALVLCFTGDRRDPRSLERSVTYGMAVPWMAASDGTFAPGAARKDLWTDPATGEETFLLGTLPLRENTHAQKHPVVEEVFLLSGELIGPHGTMLPGAYFWRPPEVWHGPYGERAGALILTRSVGGPLDKDYADEPTAFDWAPPHAPILPPETAPTAHLALDAETVPPFISAMNLSSTSSMRSGD